jgi:hypothetical protein
MKPQLAELIEAYAAARASGSRLLLEFAVGQLNEFMAKVDVTEIQKQKQEE